MQLMKLAAPNAFSPALVLYCLLNPFFRGILS